MKKVRAIALVWTCFCVGHRCKQPETRGRQRSKDDMVMQLTEDTLVNVEGLFPKILSL